MTSMTEEADRIERDSMGEVRVPSNAYYGASTERARQNFPISNLRLPRRFIRALAQIKGAAALVNAELGLLQTRLANPIQQAAEDVEEGKFDKDFVVDVFQTGSGTSTNTNANEVIANRANEILGQPLGSRQPVHPNDHVNLCQSSNDVIPAAMQLAALVAIHEELVPALSYLKDALDQKANELMPVIKTGRTHLQDATPIRLGQEFLGYAGQVERSVERVRRAAEELADLPLGGTAVGTGVNAHPEFAQRVCAHLTRRAGVPVQETDNHFQAQATLDAVLSAAGAVRSVAVSLWKIGNDLRWFASGPRAGLGEITLPEVQPGSSIMPGKVNPVIIESMTMVVARVLGNDQTITIAAQSGSVFELNLMTPVAAYCLLESIGLLSASAQNLARQCIAGIKATDRGPQMVEQGLMLATALAPAIGYDAAAKIAKEALASGKTIRQVARERTKLAAEELDRLLDPSRMTEPGLEVGPAGG
jgi:fumarate hydratase, class II